MRLFHRCSLTPAEVLAAADAHFSALLFARVHADGRSRRYRGELGTVDLKVKMEGGHYTFVEAATDQIGESRLDKNVKKLFVALHRAHDPHHALPAAY